MAGVCLFRGREISVDSLPVLSVRTFEMLVPTTNVTTNEPVDRIRSHYWVNRQQYFDFRKRMFSVTNFQTAGVFSRRFDVSNPVLRQGGFQWTMERREHRQENCCLPPNRGARTASDLSSTIRALVSSSTRESFRSTRCTY